MHKLFSLYNQNRRKFWIIIIAIFVIALIIWRLINMFTEKQNDQTQTQSTTIRNEKFNSVTLESEKSAITGQKITTTQNEMEVIDNFVSYCNEGKLQQAYNLISDECKERMYPKIEDFYNMYFLPIFKTGKKNVSIENWIGNIYKVDFNEDFLSTGKVSKENTKQDYITIVTDNENNYKLNINKYIRTIVLNKTANYENIEIQVKSKDVYMDYEAYTIEVSNNSTQTIALCDIQYSDLIYLVDSNDVQYIANVNELLQSQVICEPNSKKTIQMKFLNQYISTKRITKMVFSKLILDYKTDYSKVTQINVDL